MIVLSVGAVVVLVGGLIVSLVGGLIVVLVSGLIDLLIVVLGVGLLGVLVVGLMLVAVFLACSRRPCCCTCDAEKIETVAAVATTQRIMKTGKNISKIGI